MNAGATDTLAPRPRLLLLVTEDWYFWSHRLGLARMARDAGFDVIVGTRVNRRREDLQAEGFTVADIPFERSLKYPRSDLRALRAIRRCLHEHQPDLVHLVSLKPILLGGLATVGISRTPVVNAFTGLGYLFSSTDRLARVVRPLVIALLRVLCRRKRAWTLVQNDDDRGLLAAQQVARAGRTVVIRGSGVDTRSFAPSPLPGAVPLQVLLPARALVDKGVHEFVAAARALLARRTDVCFAIAGAADSDNHAAISMRQLESWQREGVVQWLGHRGDMPAVYAKAAIVCLPSYREGLPKALLEAAACGRPLVATDVPGCREICRDGITGLLVPVGDSEALARAIERLVDDAALRTRLGVAGRAVAEGEFSLQAVGEQTLALYRRLLADPVEK